MVEPRWPMPLTSTAPRSGSSQQRHACRYSHLLTEDWNPYSPRSNRTGTRRCSRLRSMCGRYVNSRLDADIASAFQVDEVVGDELPPSWNIAPTQQARVVLERAPRETTDAEPVRQLRTIRWGLVPSWAKDTKIGSRMVNARSETVTEKSAFKAAAARRRCIVPADGYYEWHKKPGTKTKVPYFLHRDDEILGFAGLYELRPDPDLPVDHPDRWLWTYTILTTTASDTLGHVHDRSPVLIPTDLRDDWLNPALTDLGEVRSLLDSVPEPRLEPYPVGTAVNSPKNNGPELIKPV
jgi:putative SOS response-associated peptidase YedK